MRKILFFLLFTIAASSSVSVFSQENQLPVVPAITFDSVLVDLLNSNRSTISYSNVTIDLGFFSLRKIDRLFPNARIDSGKLILDKSLEFHHCRIKGKGFSDLKINSIVLDNCSASSLNISNLEAGNFSVNQGNIAKLRILNSKINNARIRGLEGTDQGTGSITIFKSRFRGQLVIEKVRSMKNIAILGSEIGKLRFDNNQTILSGLTNNTIFEEAIFTNETARELMFRKNVFVADSIPVMLSAECERLTLLQNDFNGPVQFADTRVDTRVEIADNRFREAADFHDVSFPEFGKYVPFRQFAKGFVVYKNLYGEDSPDGANCYYCELYKGETEEELTDKTNFDKLVQSYEILFHGYKSTGDIESANLSYIRIKDLYLNRLGYLYRTNGGFKHYFRWKLAQLLKFYTNHGTDPALSIVISIYVILIFAVFYVFFPSEWDVTSKARLVADFKTFIEQNDKGRLKPFITLLVGFGISIINAITLSLNSFVTLGFGTIPTTGAARYVCILQGFIGWFLLSIFTVSLINQILF